jgi:hypothetical protein
MPETMGCGGGDASENAPCRLRYGGNRKATPEKKGRAAILSGRARTLKEWSTLLINHHGKKKGTKIKKHSE